MTRTIPLLLAALLAVWLALPQPTGTAPASALPAVLPENDRHLYHTIFQAQKAADWATADESIARLSSPALVGHILAERYLHPSYATQVQELTDWLSMYADLPQAASIYTLAVGKNPALKNSLPGVEKRARMSGYGDDHGPMPAADTRQWKKGLAAWRAGEKAEAAQIFSALALTAKSPWQASAAAYWAHRAELALNRPAEAAKHLRQAAQDARSFYGILARKQLHQPLELDAQTITLSEADIQEMSGRPAIRRILALSEAGMTELAEKELRAAFPHADADERTRLLALAHELNLASVQIGMARSLSRDGRTYDYARYPVPRWQPKEGFTIDPALLYALMRQESGFRVSAVSSGGALGLMQLMPKTASLMHRRIGGEGNVTEPSLNMSLGQNYLHHLLETELVENNLFYLLAAYNAGPGRLQEWKARLDYGNDPLLFVESIPFSQTRHYVKQVMANYWIYSELAERPNDSVRALLAGRWPGYDAGAPVAAYSLAEAG